MSQAGAIEAAAQAQSEINSAPRPEIGDLTKPRLDAPEAKLDAPVAALTCAETGLLAEDTAIGESWPSPCLSSAQQLHVWRRRRQDPTWRFGPAASKADVVLRRGHEQCLATSRQQATHLDLPLIEQDGLIIGSGNCAKVSSLQQVAANPFNVSTP